MEFSYAILICICLIIKYSNCFRQSCTRIEPSSYCNNVRECSLYGFSGYLDCQNKFCCCANGSEYKTTHGCYMNKYLGDNCKFNYDCVIKYAMCINNICQCPNNLQLKDGECKEIKTKKYLGDECKNTEDCKILHSICENNICICPKKMLLRDGICQEAERKYLGESCTNSNECSIIENSFCNNNICECPEKMILKNGKCQESDKKYLGEKCQKDDECFIENSVCIEHICSCNKGQHYINGSCLSYVVCASNEALFNGQCEKFAKCKETEVLVNGICEESKTENINSTNYVKDNLKLVYTDIGSQNKIVCNCTENGLQCQNKSDDFIWQGWKWISIGLIIIIIIIIIIVVLTYICRRKISSRGSYTSVNKP